jgi:hypothetical protein
MALDRRGYARAKALRFRRFTCKTNLEDLARFRCDERHTSFMTRGRVISISTRQTESQKRPRYCRGRASARCLVLGSRLEGFPPNRSAAQSVEGGTPMRVSATAVTFDDWKCIELSNARRIGAHARWQSALVSVHHVDPWAVGNRTRRRPVGSSPRRRHAVRGLLSTG